MSSNSKLFGEVNLNQLINFVSLIVYLPVIYLSVLRVPNHSYLKYRPNFGKKSLNWGFSSDNAPKRQRSMFFSSLPEKPGAIFDDESIDLFFVTVFLPGRENLIRSSWVELCLHGRRFRRSNRHGSQATSLIARRIITMATLEIPNSMRSRTCSSERSSNERYLSGTRWNRRTGSNSAIPNSGRRSGQSNETGPCSRAPAFPTNGCNSGIYRNV